MLNQNKLTIKGKLLHSIVLAPALFLPLIWVYVYSAKADPIDIMFVVDYAAAVSVVCAYCITMYIEHWYSINAKDKPIES